MTKVAQFLEREGGHLAVLLFLVVFFTLFARFSDGPFFEKVALVGFGAVLGALIMGMKGSGNQPPTLSVEHRVAPAPSGPASVPEATK